MYIMIKNIFHDKTSLIYWFLPILISVFIVRSAFPTAYNYLYYPLIILSIVLFFINIKGNSLKLFRINTNYFKWYWLLLLTFLIIALLNFNVFALKESVLGLSAILIINLWVVLVDSRKGFVIIFSRSVRFIQYQAVFISMICLGLNFFKPKLLDLFGLFRGFSMADDYNMYVLILIIGIISILYRMKSSISKLEMFLLPIFFWIIVLNIFLAGSRRGLIVLVIVIAFYLSFFILGIFKKNNSNYRFYLNNRYSIGFISFMFTILFAIFINCSPTLKFNSLNINDKGNTIKENLRFPFMRYFNKPEEVVDGWLWFNNYNSLFNKFYFPKLENKIDKIFLNKSKNYFKNQFLQDEPTNFMPWNNASAYKSPLTDSINYLIAFSDEQNNGVFTQFDVPRNVDIHIRTQIYVYKWSPNLRIMTYARGKYESFPIPQQWCRKGWKTISMVTNYSSNDLPRLWIGGGTMEKISVSCWTDFQLNIKIDNNFTDLYDSYKKIDKDLGEVIKNENNIFNVPTKFENKLSKWKLSKINDKELATISIIHDDSKLNDNRIIKWKFGLNLWLKEYKWYEKIFGKGFEYLEDFGTKFYGKESIFDYPHNPLISSLLYSGIIGFILYMIFLFKMAYSYYKTYITNGSINFVFAVVWIFATISGNSHFSIPAFIFLSILPFLALYYKNDIPNE